MHVILSEIQQQNIPLVKSWLVAKDNAKWLDPFFQGDNIRDEQLAIFLMRRDKLTYLIVCDGTPVGLTGLTKIDKLSGSAEIWSVIGDTNYRRKGVSTTGFVLALHKAFFAVSLHSVNAWAVDGNFTIRIFEKLGFTRIGRQRQCHLQDGVLKDRILFDILRSEFEGGPFAKQVERV